MHTCVNYNDMVMKSRYILKLMVKTFMHIRAYYAVIVLIDHFHYRINRAIKISIALQIVESDQNTRKMIKRINDMKWLIIN